MILKVIGSSSKGNGYILESDNEALLIECGVRFDGFLRALDFNVQKVVGCLVSHEHGDHCKYAHEVLKYGIPIYSSAGTLAAMKIKDSRKLMAMVPQMKYQIGSFTIVAFKVEHDAAEPVGFLIHHEDMGLTCFITDTVFTKFKFKGLNNMIVECNYDEGILDQRGAPEFLRNRILGSHMNIETLTEYFKSSDMKQVHNVVLIHLSDANSNAREFKQKIIDATGCSVYIADTGMKIPFDKQPF